MSLAALSLLAGCGGSTGSNTPSTPSFSLFLSTQSVTVMQGGSVASPTLTVSALNGFSGAVTLTSTGLPAGVAATFAPAMLTGSGQSTLTLTASSTATLATAQAVTVQGTSGNITQTATFALAVTGPPSITVSAPAALTIYPGVTGSLPVTVSGVNGFSGSVTLALSGLPAGISAASGTLSSYTGNSANFSLSALSTAASGTLTITATATTTGGATLTATARTAITVNATPDFSIAPVTQYSYQGSFGSFYLSLTYYNGYSLPVNVVFGTPSNTAVTVQPASVTLTSAGSTTAGTISVPFSVPAGTPVTIPVTATSGSLVHSTTITINPLANAVVVVPQSSISVHANSSTTVSVEVNTYANGNTLGNIALAVTSAPAGITVTPSSLSLPAFTSQVFSVTASSAAVSGNIVFTGTTTGLSSTGTTAVTVLAPVANVPTTVRSHSAYVRTDATAEYGSFPPPNWSLYDAASGNFFAADYGTGRVNVIASSTGTQVASLVVPGAFGLGQAPAGGLIYAGTLSGDIYVIDPVALAVTHRIPMASIGSSGFAANAVYPRPDGTLLLENYFLVPAYSFVDAYESFVLWSPTTNALTTIPQCSGQGTGFLPPGSYYSGTTFGFPTNNGARLLQVPQYISPTSTLLCSQNLATGAVIKLTAATQSTPYLTTLALSPDGNTIAGYDGTNVSVIDAATLTVKRTFAASSKSTLGAYPSMVIGPDNQTLYLTGADSGEHVLIYNMTTGALTGWLPAVQLAQPAAYAPSVPLLQGLSANGLLGGVMDQGFGLIDTTAVNPLPVGSAFGISTVTPSFGPVAGGTAISWSVAQQGTTTTAPALGSTYVGGNAATGLSVSSGGVLNATTPVAVSSGPASVITVTPDGGEQLLPEAFSYGPSVLEATTSYATAEGGGPASLYGYGFGSSYFASTTPVVTPPTDLQVLVGGANASVTGYLPGPYQLLNYFTNPLPLEGAEYTMPAGIAGTSAALTVTNSAGTTTAAQRITYLPATVQYALAGASLLDGVYDSTRDVYYFTDVAQVRVFSLTQAKWLTSIPVPAPAFPCTGSQRLRAVALSPNRAYLAVSDSGSCAVAKINLANGNTVQTFGLASSASQAPNGLTFTPAGVAISNAGTLFFATYDQNGDGGSFLYTLNPSTGKYSGIAGSTGGVFGPFDEGNFPTAKVALSPDGTTLYFADYGQVGSVNAATGALISYCNECTDLTEGYDLTLSTDGTTLFGASALLDAGVHLRALQSYNYREAFDASYIDGAAFSHDNKLLFQPGAQFLDVYDARTGVFAERISLPLALNAGYRALVANDRNNTLLLVNAGPGGGVSTLDLSALPAAPTLPY